MNKKFGKKSESGFLEIKRKHDEILKENFFDVQIHCESIIFPAHRYVLSSRSIFLAEQLASGVDKLNWAEFEEKTCIALLRWIYTNEVAFSYRIEVTAEQWLDLLHASYKLHLVSLFMICEKKLLSLLNDSSYRLSRFRRRLYDVSKKVGSNQLMQKCSELRLNVPDIPQEEQEAKDVSSEELEEKIAEVNELADEAFEELLLLNKLSFGYHEFRQFSDTEVIIGDDVWRAHAHVLGSRSKKILKEVKQTIERTGTLSWRMGFDTLYERMSSYGIKRIFLRWIYTDCVVFEHNNAVDLLKVSHFYELPALFERCEDAVVRQVNITSCAWIHQLAEKRNATKIVKRCNQLIAQYFNKAKSPDCSEMNHEITFDNSLSEMMVCESPTEAVEGLLTLNDDCLLHLFRFVSVADLGSIKITCKRLRPLADQSFKLRKDKSLKISSNSMFADIWTLKHFGKFIQSLRLERFYRRFASLDNILEMIAQFTGEELKSISFYECDEREGESFECLKTLLKNVECIELEWLNYDININSILGYCENLKEVNIDGQEMKLNSDWCSKNSNVTKLTMIGLEDDEILEEIGNKLTRLESLSLDCIETPTGKIIHLSRLSHLTKLRISASMIDQVLQHFTDKTVLKDLCLLYQNLTGSLASVLGEFPNLSNLVFENCGHFDENVQYILSRKLINIETLTFVDCDEITFKAIKNIIENLLDLKKLSVDGCNKVEFIDSDDYLSLRKMRHLQIFLCWDAYTRTCELIGNNWLGNVQVELLD